MKILVTGGAGFIGSNLADYFLGKNLEVLVFDNLSRSGAEKNLEWLKSKHKNKFTFINADVRDFDKLKQSLKDVDAVFHTAAQVAVTTSIKNPRGDFETNALGTLNLLEAVRQNNTNPVIVYTSTNKVYGDNVNKIPLVEKETRYEFADPKFYDGIPETFPTDAGEHTPYGCSKYTGDVYMKDYSKVYGLSTVIFRMSCIYGPRQFGNEDQGWIAHFIISSILGIPLVIYGNGKQVRDALFIDDLVKAFELTINNINKIKGNAYNIGGGSENTISLLELLNMLKKLELKPKYHFDDWRAGDQKVYISNISALEKLGWRPKISVTEGVQRLINWVNENKTIFSSM